MKATAQKTNARSTPKAGSTARVQAKIQTGVRNRHRAFRRDVAEKSIQMRRLVPTGQLVDFTRDRFEQEADNAAERFLGGETGIARRLSRTQPAEFRTGESRGIPLPALLLNQLEHSFGADLSQVRLHDGRVASDLAQNFGASAFAAGRDIYLSRSAPSITSEPGRRLIAHEVAHTIQQAGRVSAGNRIAVVDTRGQRRPQLAYKCPLESTPESKRPTFDELTKFYSGTYAGKKKTIALINEIKKDRGTAITAGDEAGFWTSLEKKTKDDKAYDSAEREAKSFVFDALKLNGKTEAAAYLLSKEIHLSSLFFVKEVYESLPEIGFEWLATFWQGAPIFIDKSDPRNPRDFSPGRFIESIYQFLMGATRDIPDLGLNGNFQTIISDELKQRESPTGFVDNELYNMALWSVKEVDRIRVEKLGELSRKEAPELVGKSGFAQSLSPHHRKNVATELVKWADTLAGSTPELTKPSDEVKFLYSKLAPAIRETASNAEKFWGDVELFQTALKTGQGIEGLVGKPSAILKKFADRDEFQKFRKAIEKSAKKQLELKSAKTDGSDPGEQTIYPSPAEYNKALDAFIKTMRTEYWFRFESKLFAESRKPPAPQGKAPTSKQANPALALTYGWMAYELYDLLDVLGQYERERDDAFVADAATLGRADVRIEHRNKLGMWLWFFGNSKGWQEFMVLGNAVISAQQEKQTQSQIAILGDWKEDKVPIKKLTEDFGPGRIVNTWESLTFGDVVNYYQTLRMTDITNEISRMMSQPGAFDPTQDTVLVTRAIRASDEKAKTGKLYPRRFSVDEYVANIKPEDMRAGNFATVIRAHPKTQALLAAERPVDGDSFAPELPGQGLFLWIIPSALPFIRTLQSFEEFNGLIFKKRFPDRDFTADDLRPIRAMDPLPWFKELAEATLVVDPKLVAEARKSVSQHLRTSIDIAKTAMRAKMQEASILERDNRILSVLIPALNEYDRYGQFSPSTTLGGIIFEIPGRVLMQIGAIASAMAPVDQQNFHYAAMFLQLADLMNKKFKENPREDVANDYYPAIMVAIGEVAKSKDSILSIMPGKDGAWIDAQVGTLTSLTEILKTKLLTGQMSFGLIGHVEGSTQFVSGVGEGDIIKAEENSKRDPFTIDGIVWAIVRVHKNFKFHPRYGALPAVLYVDGKEVSEEERTESLVLITVNLGGKNLDITAAPKHEELLAKLSYAVTMALIVRGLLELAEFIETFSELTLDALELIPGAGQAVMAARIAVAILTFIASGEAQMYIDALTKDPLGEIKRVLDLLTSLFSPDELWQFLLLGNNKFDQLHAKPKPKTPVSAPKSTVQKFLRLMSRVENVGKGVLGSVGRMQSHVRWEMEAVQMLVMRHPLLAGALHWISNHLEQIVQVTLMAIAIGEKLVDKSGGAAPDESEADLKTRFDQAVNDVPTRINTVALQVGELHLPEELIPLDELVEVMVQILLSRLGAKYRIVGGVILKLLEISGKKKDVFSAVAALIPKEADPNTYWKELVVEPVTPWLNTAKDELIDTFYDQLLKFDFFKAKKDVLESGRTAAKGEKVGAKTGNLPEATVQPYGRMAGLSKGKTVGPLPTSAPPLASSIRSNAESRFGHDFSHVRLATGTAGGSFASRFGADAVTSGSNVFLRQGLSPTSGSGARILDHELVHVLQQTGARPLGGHHSSRPVAGSSNRGLLIDPVSERAADRVAGAVRSRGRSTPVSVGKAGKGWQPALPYNVIRGLLDDISSTGDIEKDEAKVDMTGASAGLKKIPEAQKPRVGKFAENLKAAINAAKDFEAPFNQTTGTDIPAAIKDHLISGGPSGDSNFAAIERALADLAADSLRWRKAKPGEVKEDEPQTVAHIDSSRFAVALARYIFGRTGILMKLDLLPSDNTDETTAITVSKISVIYVHLPPVRANHRLWTAAVDGLTGRNKEETDLLADKDRLFRRLRLYLESKGPSPGIWKPRTYGLQQRVLSELVEFVKAMAAGGADLLPSELPGKKEYLDPSGSPGPLGHIGLRIGTYKNSKNQQGKDRESHHTTQFLLLEYFAHLNSTQTGVDTKPFPLIAQKADIYPGLTATTTAPTMFTGATKMDIAGLVKGERGDAMPAILIARPTHRAGNLHVTTKADDFGDNVDSPASVVNFIFHEKLGGDDGDYRKAEKGGVAAFEAYKVATGDEAVKLKIYTSMQETYKWMRDLMRDRLNNALPGIEMKYYNQLAEDGGKKDRLKPGEMALVSAAAKQNNTAEMKGWG